jgi:ABC-type bacteriocin/lantibiotic exporter with double-glycine peptidase domain
MKKSIKHLLAYHGAVYDKYKFDHLQFVDRENFYEEINALFTAPLIHYNLEKQYISQLVDLPDCFVLLGDEPDLVKWVDGVCVTRSNIILPVEQILGKPILVLTEHPKVHDSRSFTEVIMGFFPKKYLFILLLTPFVLLPAFFTNLFNTRLIYNNEVYTLIFIAAVFVSAFFLDYIGKIWIKRITLEDLKKNSDKIERYFLLLLPFLNQANIITKIRTIESSKKMAWESMSALLVDCVVFVLLFSVLFLILGVKSLALLMFYVLLITLSIYIRYRNYKIHVENENIQQELLVERIYYYRNNKQFLQLDPSFYLSEFEKVYKKAIGIDTGVTLINFKWDEFVKASSFVASIVLFLVIYFEVQSNVDIFTVLIALLIINGRVSSAAISFVTKSHYALFSFYHIRKSIDALFDSVDESVYSRGFLVTDIDKITLKNFSIKIEENVLIEPVNLEFTRGLIYGISGGVGTGKSTLMKCLSRSFCDYSGEIVFNTQYKLRDIDSSFSYKKTAYLDLDSDFIPGSLYYNFLVRGHRDRDKITFIVQGILKNKLIDYEILFKKDIFSIHMSTGQKRMLLVLMTLSPSKKIYIFDEVLSNITVADFAFLVNSIRALAANAIIFVVSHDQNLLKAFDVVYEIKNKKLSKKKGALIKVAGPIDPQ